MKVKVAYTVDLEEVPSRADPLIVDAKSTIKEALKKADLLKSAKEQSIEKCLTEIEETIHLLSKATIFLQDADAMLAGYLHLRTSNHNQHTGENEDND